MVARVRLNILFYEHYPGILYPEHTLEIIFLWKGLGIFNKELTSTLIKDHFFRTDKFLRKGVKVTKLVSNLIYKLDWYIMCGVLIV